MTLMLIRVSRGMRKYFYIPEENIFAIVLRISKYIVDLTGNHLLSTTAGLIVLQQGTTIRIAMLTTLL